MVSVVLDTNVLVATLISPDGSHAKVLEYLLEHLGIYEIVVSSQIADEYRDVLARPFLALRGLAEEAQAFLALLLSVAVEVVPTAIPQLVYPDIEDKPFVEAAVYTNGLLITNNVRDYPFIGVRILRADEFLRFARGRNLS